MFVPTEAMGVRAQEFEVLKMKLELRRLEMEAESRRIEVEARTAEREAEARRADKSRQILTKFGNVMGLDLRTASAIKIY